MSGSMQHIPVLAGRVLELLAPTAGETFLDCTAGRGGHAALILPRLAPGGRYIGLDLDPENVAAGSDRLSASEVQSDLLQANFAGARAVLDSLGVGAVDGLLADLGFASTQMDDPARGLSFSRPGPLDMRLDPSSPVTAADLVNRLSERELADVIFRYGEERLSRRIARKIVEARRRSPINRTEQLAELCGAAYGSLRHRQRIDPATRTFQALRIAVNHELDNLDALLESLPTLMRKGGRVAVISFHSLEDRQVKQAFIRYVTEGRAERLTRKPLTPDEAEASANRRSRSAKLRAIRWLGSVEP
jgi:16S rRNA (cytosine1402-N4)-methyltransferase